MEFDLVQPGCAEFLERLTGSLELKHGRGQIHRNKGLSWQFHAKKLPKSNLLIKSNLQVARFKSKRPRKNTKT